MPVLSTSPHKLPIREAVAVEEKKKKFTFESVDGRKIPSEKALNNFFRTYNAIFLRHEEEERSGSRSESQDTTGEVIT